ncbi:MAG: DUF4249 domain-containing protein [Saprospiraceae bacterium]|nr:DUF4249 domain-containing protein [Saprospiraceae bacterium]
MTWRSFILISLLGSMACVDPIDLDLPEGQEQLVVFSNLIPDSLVSLKLIRTRSILSTASNNFVNNATVGIFQDDLLRAKLSYVSPSESGDPDPQYLNDSFRPAQGIEYELRVDVLGEEPLTSISTIPFPTPMGEIEVDSVKLSESVVDRNLKLVTIVGSVKITDPGESRNYYHLATADISFDWFEIVGGDTTFTYNAEKTSAIPVRNTEVGNAAYTSLFQGPGFLVDDRFLADGENKVPFRLSFLHNPSFQEFNHMTLFLRHCDKAYFEFHRSLSRQIQTGENPFAEPVVLATNVENGLGYFSGYSLSLGDYFFPPN